MLFDIYLLAYFVGTLLGLWFVFQKAGLAGWKALVPIWNIVLWIKICGKNWKWYIYMLIPAINVFTFLLLVVETAKCFRRYGFWEQTFAVIFPWIYLPILGFSKKLDYTNPKELPPHKISQVRDWLDAIVFALVAAVIIRGDIVEFYNIPSSSMEGSLMTGDYLMVSKIAYGPRTAMTPLSFPLVHNVLPFTNGQKESYFDFLHLPYHRYCGLGGVERFDAVVFNYPEGDTVCSAFQSERSYYDLVREAGWDGQKIDLERGRQIVMSNPSMYGKIVVRPTDKKENFIKRCLGLPGETLEIKDGQVYIDGNAIDNPSMIQYSYRVYLKDRDFSKGYVMMPNLDKCGLSNENKMMMDPRYLQIDEERQMCYAVTFLNEANKALLEQDPNVVMVERVVEPLYSDTVSLKLYPHVADTAFTKWTVDNFGPIYIPKQGGSVKLTKHNADLYRRVIVNYEGNTLEERDGQYLLNGQPATEYTFKMDYFWMQGDNRHNSADSRFWGFVPEDHIVGKASMVVLSKDPDKRGFFKSIRWDRLFYGSNFMKK